MIHVQRIERKEGKERKPISLANQGKSANQLIAAAISVVVPIATIAAIVAAAVTAVILCWNTACIGFAIALLFANFTCAITCFVGVVAPFHVVAVGLTKTLWNVSAALFSVIFWFVTIAFFTNAIRFLNTISVVAGFWSVACIAAAATVVVAIIVVITTTFVAVTTTKQASKPVSSLRRRRRE